jgi:branched-chain amino acid transport system ATP-binding protein
MPGLGPGIHEFAAQRQEQVVDGRDKPGLDGRLTMAEPLLELAGVASGYGPIAVLHDVSLRVGEGEIVAVLGANGAGKSTLLRTISGIVPARRGTIRFGGRALNGMPGARIVGEGLSHVPEGREVFPALTVRETLMMGAYRRHDAGGVARDLAEAYAYFPILKERQEQVAGLLSGGQQQMLAIARAMMARPKLLLLDEPSLGLSPILTREIWAMLTRLNRERGTAILLVEQNVNLALKIAARAYVMELGRIALEGAAAEIADRPEIREAYLGRAVHA